ncbi:SH3 domain-containing protein [Pseudoroseicyclus sp. CXY001]|uniref:SH3 domain-containing protein n=1 Tax=Pseudoroseicyclus sp. CXY001 TaxID=3242492 RepID=UPI003570B5E4
MRLAPILLLALAGCVTSAPSLSDRVAVGDTGEEPYLNMRSGPGLGYRAVLGLPEGTALNRHDCVTELGQLWCRVSLAGSPNASGYVSADYLVAR